MQKALIVVQSTGASKYSSATLVGDKAIATLGSPTARKILRRLAETESYPMEMAEDLRLNPQRVYYHIRRMREAGVITVSRHKMVRGARAQIYSPAGEALVYHVGAKWESYGHPIPPPKTVASFFGGFYDSDQFVGRIVVGSPEEHGPFKIKARDGHYSAHLSMFLGRFWRPPEDFVVKLDVDVKAEKAENQNLILVGGPGANIVTASVNRFLPIKFREDNYWLGLEGEGKRYSGESVGIIAKIPNPFSNRAAIIVLAGIRFIGTKAAVLALTKEWDRTLSTYEGEDAWARVVQGFDLDGDGKIDNVEILDGG